jgi:hypothetical protein
MSQLIVLQGVRTVQLGKGKSTLVDEADWLIVSQLTWYAVRSDRKPATGPEHWYARHSISKTPGQPMRCIYLHRHLIAAPTGMHVDHRNGDGLDNRRENIRLCTKTENKRNVRTSWGASKFKGVCFDKTRGTWKAHLMSKDRRRIHIGRFPTEIEAAQAYDEAVIREYGEFACTNAEMYGALTQDASPAE